MNKNEFLAQLRKSLQKLPIEEQESTIADYEEHFGHGVFKGRTEEEITTSLGEPKKIAIELITEYYLENAQQTKTYTNLSRAVFASIGLGFLNLIFVLAPFVAVVAVIIALYAVSFALIISPLTIIFTAFSGYAYSTVFLVGFITLSLLGLGLIIGVMNMYFARKFFGWFSHYLKSNLQIIRGERT